MGDGTDAFRYNHLDPIFWLPKGYDAGTLIRSMPALLESLTHPNVALDNRLTGSSTYVEVLDKVVFHYYSGNISLAEAQVTNQLVKSSNCQKQLQDGWNNITNSIGRAQQLVIYRKSLGLPPLVDEKSSEKDQTVAIVGGAVGGVAVLVIGAMAAAIAVVMRRASKFSNALVIKESDIVLGTVIGSGGFGTVFKGTWQGNTVAIKRVLFSKKKSSEGGDKKNSALATHRNSSQLASKGRKSQLGRTAGVKQLWTKELLVISKLRHTNVLSFAFTQLIGIVFVWSIRK